jgi:nitroreductase/NAD-dependent dihydropyrimidine dehydrogenase PreA subunit
MIMSITGVNQELCSACRKCIADCSRGLFKADDSGKVEHNGDPMGTCNFCGKCVAICKEKAIIWEGSWEDDVESFPGVKNYEKNVSYNDLMQLLKAKRSVRQYKNKQIPPDVLTQVFEAMRYASSADNRRAWNFSVVSDPGAIAQLSRESIKFVYTYLGFQSADQALEFFSAIDKDPIFYRAPSVIFLTTGETGAMPQVDSGIVLTYGQLAAHALGLATCWIGMAHSLAMNEEMMNLIGLKGEIHGALTIGYPSVKYHNTPPRAPVSVIGLD